MHYVTFPHMHYVTFPHVHYATFPHMHSCVILADCARDSVQHGAQLHTHYIYLQTCEGLGVTRAQLICRPAKGLGVTRCAPPYTLHYICRLCEGTCGWPLTCVRVLGFWMAIWQRASTPPSCGLRCGPRCRTRCITHCRTLQNTLQTCLMNTHARG
jgi:hypothetical protein